MKFFLKSVNFAEAPPEVLEKNRSTVAGEPRELGPLRPRTGVAKRVFAKFGRKPHGLASSRLRSMASKVGWYAFREDSGAIKMTARSESSAGTVTRWSFS